MDIVDDQRDLAGKTLSGSIHIDRCPICRSQTHKPYVKVFGFCYCECLKCEHIFCQDVPSDQALEDLYTPDSETSNAQHKVYLDEGKFNERVLQIATPKVDFVLDMVDISLFKSGVHWLDIGCGAGEVLSDCLSRGFSVCGLEVDSAQVEFARNKGIEIVSSVLNEENASNLIPKASIVSIINVLEHIKDPKFFLSLVVKYLDPASFLVFEVPKHPSLSSVNRVLFPDLAYRHIYPPDHLHIFSDQSLDNLLKGNGLEVVAIWSFGQDADEFLSSVLLDRGIKNQSKESDMLMNLAPRLQQLVDLEGLSDTMLVLAKKVRE